MIETFRNKPWLLVLIAIAFFLALSLTFLVIALANPPRLL